MNNKLFTLMLVLAMAFGATGYALAATSDTGDATATISAGSLSVTTTDTIDLSVTLDGTDQTALDEGVLDYVAEDATGSGAGWHINISATDFDAGGPGPYIGVANFKVKQPDADITVVAGNTKPTSSITSYTALSTTPAKLMSAAVSEGMGEYQFDPDFSLDVAAETDAGSYTSIVTFEIVTAP
jgi:hypothetical protein